MSKPLTIFLQLAGLFMIVGGAAGSEPNLTLIGVGAAFVLLGGAGIRKRIKEQRK